ncbi:CehA/McbA family metallohydrolase [Novosphingobium sp. 1949]|uniref:CehA/McbA family metallohydrolase n=1 Tax=Novosphingobium organovorum TaxID=2930092 RepID=A0ABT0B8Z5_9SPHN|nr:CehA/McbA family metallohydrolase [Novosphingobium organovorum]MCJ2181498.1 CehA/McbA family metallohydrolase [Novosphingobium organovorum]
MARAEDAPQDGAFDDVIVSGVLHDSDRASYRELPFTVPAGVSKITLRLEGNDPDKGTYLVLGVYDTERLRGWGGAIKPEVTIARTFASTSYLPGPLPAGQWRASLRVASIRKGVAAPYRLVVHFERGAPAQALYDAPVRQGRAWYLGDFHTHTGQSDGKCRSRPSGKAVPCPVLRTLEAAYDHGLDFVSVSDHNVAAQDAELAVDAAYFDAMLVIPGREMTTAQGHFNLTGVTDYVDFRLGAPGPRDINAIFRAARPTGALLSINHPEIPTGEACLGCGWSAPDTDFSLLDAIEVANGGVAADAKGHFDDGEGSGTQWWERLLNRGYHLTGIGGSDNHDPVDGHAGSSPVGEQSPVGTPATAVEAADLSQPAILAGVRAGRVFIDLTGAHHDHGLDLEAKASSGARVAMGGTLRLGAKDTVRGAVLVRGLAGARVDLILDGRHLPLGAGAVVGADAIGAGAGDGWARVSFAFAARDLAKGQAGHWLRADVRDAAGTRLLIGNPIYLEPGQ